jgi:hypothetical protein
MGDVPTTNRKRKMACKLTPIRLAWLLHLHQHGDMPLKQMPRRAGTKASPGQPTYRPMIEAGWIDQLEPTRGSMLRDPVWFRITAQGRDILAPHVMALIKAEDWK